MSDQFDLEKDKGYKWYLQVKNADVVAQHVALEASLSFPIGSEDELRFFHYRIVDGQVRRPLTYIRAAVPSMTLREFTLGSQRPIFVGLPEDAGSNDATWNKAVQIDALNLIPALIKRYPSEPAGILGQQYWEVVAKLSPSGLLSFYEALNPDFVKWLRHE